MREYKYSLAAAPLALCLIVAASGVARAQSSADQIISALKPSGNVSSSATRGIRLGGASQDAAAPAPVHRASTGTSDSGSHAASAPPRASAVAAQPAASGPSVNLTVNFLTGSAELTAAARAQLDALGKALSSSDLASFRFRIEGHTDNVGSREDNVTLSQRRANTVVNYLTEQFKVAPGRLEAAGMGPDRPLVQTPPQTPEARNRRVQVINLGA